MALERLLKRKLIACSPDTSVQEAAEIMDEENVGCVVVVTDKKPVGILTDRDITIRCIARHENCEDLPVSEIMTRDVETVTLESGLFDVVEVMGRNEIRRVPVVDTSGRVVGLLSFGDVHELISKELSYLSKSVTPEEKKISEEAA